MSIYEVVDPTTAELERLFWSLVPVVAEQAQVTQADAVFHLRRAWSDRLKGFRTYESVDFRDDGRAAAWRVRLTIWTGPDNGSLVADTDDGRPSEADGTTILYGLSAVADWVRELTAQAHPGCVLDGLSEATLATKIKSLRVALSNQGGASIWRLRYAATPAVVEAAPAVQTGPGVNLLKAARQLTPRVETFLAHVRVSREESPRHRA